MFTCVFLSPDPVIKWHPSTQPVHEHVGAFPLHGSGYVRPRVLSWTLWGRRSQDRTAPPSIRNVPWPCGMHGQFDLLSQFNFPLITRINFTRNLTHLIASWQNSLSWSRFSFVHKFKSWLTKNELLFLHFEVHQICGDLWLVKMYFYNVIFRVSY